MIFNPAAPTVTAVNIDPRMATCQTESIHAPGAIQAWGALLIAGADDLVVRHASRNLADFLGFAGADAIGRQLAELIGQAAASKLLADTKDGDVARVAAPPLSLTAHRLDGRLYVECEPDETVPARTLTLSTGRIVDRLRAATSFEDLFEAACEALRVVTGFDRVLVYKFGPDQHGQVIADSCAEGIETLLGLHYPAEDIPPQARAIFARLKVRVIGNSHAAPVALLPAGVPGMQPDLSLCALRTPSPCHTEYLRNMGSHATATVALMVDGLMWGILACHHGAPARLAPDRRALCELIGQVTSLMVVALRDASARASEAASQARLRTIFARLATRQDDPAALADLLVEDADELLALCDAQGAIVRVGGRLAWCGTAPSGEAAGRLLDCLLEVLPTRSRNAGDQTAVLDCDSLGDVIDKGLLDQTGQPAGALLLPLAHAQGDAVVWLRPEQATIVSWGGDPNHCMTFDAERGRLVPRSSFAVWREEVRGRSLPWQETHLQSALGLRGKIDKTLAGYAESMRLARVAAERATKAKSEFLATMSHEIRSPMSGLLGVLELLRATELTAEQGRMAGMIHNSASMLLAVLNDILDFSKIEAGALSIAAEPVRLRALLQDLVQPHSVAAAQKGLLVRFTVDVSVPDRILTDPLRLRQILGNLLSNAVKFTAAGEVCLSVATVDSGLSQEILFVVKDTGIGMSDAVMARLFAPFMQADGSTTRNFGGTGLGLCISRQLARLLDGDLSVASEPGKGSAFSLALKLVPCPEDAAEPPVRGEPVLPVCTAGRRVLVVDDDSTIRWLSQRQLDLLLTDCHMPRMDGVSLTRAVRASDGALRAIPIIGLTADVTENQRVLCQEAGMNDLAIKPMTVESLSLLLQRHLPASGPAGPQEGHEAVPPVQRPLAFDNRIFLSIFEPGDQEGAAWLTEWLQAARADVNELGASLRVPEGQDAARQIVGSTAHRLAGSSFSVGAMRLGEAARALEHAALQADALYLHSAYETLHAELEAGAAAITDFLTADRSAHCAGARI